MNLLRLLAWRSRGRQPARKSVQSPNRRLGKGLLLLERLLVPEEPAPATTLMDLTMLVIGGGTGRTAAEYRRLFEEAGFEMIRVVPTGTPRFLFEAKPKLP